MYHQCPKRWKLNYVDKLRVADSNIHLVFGSAMHTTIQLYLQTMYDASIKSADSLDLEEILQGEMIEEFQEAEKKYGSKPATAEQLREFFEDGINIINFLKKKRADYFGKKGWKLVGIEEPISLSLGETQTKKKIGFIGYLDVVLLHEPTNLLKIIDLKTSTRGWNKYQKKDQLKTAQLLLYKKFYSEMTDHPIDKIDVEYIILKRKLYENTDFPQKRIQRFSPANGKPSINRVTKQLDEFINGAFGEKLLDATPSKSACRWCEFNQTEHCTEGVR
jgi:hypothetical protein